MTYRPLSARDTSDPRFEGPAGGVPEFLQEPVEDWIRSNLIGHSLDQRRRLQELQTRMRLSPPLDWTNGDTTALADLMARIRRSEAFALDALDYLLHFEASDARAAHLYEVLEQGGSIWEIVAAESGKWMLAQRSIGPVSEVVGAVESESQRAHHHLSTAWVRLVGRDPDPSTAYREAVRAIEVVAKPVVSPDNDRATLGTMIRDIRAKPEKWEVILENTSPEDIAAMAEHVWTNQLDRHGTDNENMPLNVSQEQADAAFHIALGLVRLFASGAIRVA